MAGVKAKGAIMDGIIEGRLAAHRAYMVLAAAGPDSVANPKKGNTVELKMAMRKVANLEKRDEEFQLGFEAVAEEIRKNFYRLTGFFSWTQPDGTAKA